ncbi:hypothetical protein ABTM13_19665, partial [Acinetobacter baumannii]
ENDGEAQRQSDAQSQKRPWLHFDTESNTGRTVTSDAEAGKVPGCSMVTRRVDIRCFFRFRQTRFTLCPHWRSDMLW